MSSNLLNFGFRKLSEAEIKRRNEERALAYDPIEVERGRAVKKEVQKLKAEEEAAQKAELARFLSMKRQQRFRERERLKKARDKENHEDGITQQENYVALLPIAVPPQKPNWFDPSYWNDIVMALNNAGFNSRRAVQALKIQYSFDGRFNSLSHSTLEGWFSRTVDESGNNGIVWHEKILLKVQSRQSMYTCGTGRSGILDPHPEIVSIITDLLQKIRATGSVINGSTARIVILGVLQSKIPEILFENGGHFRVSSTWVSDFCATTMGWTFRKGTTAAQKLPADYNNQGYMTILRLAYYVRVFNVPMSHVFNADQTGVVLIPSGNDRTHDIKGKKDFSVIGGEEKRAFTAVLGSAANGTILPFQSIWKGKTVGSLSSTWHHFSHLNFQYSLNDQNHWSNLKTTQEYFHNVLRSRVNDDEYWVAFIDCWKIHKSKAFLAWIREKYPKCLILFVPAGCTGKFQPADLLLQRILKHIIRREFNHFMSDIQSFKLNTKLGYLRDLTPRFLAKAYTYLRENQDVVIKSWTKAAVDAPDGLGQINLLSAWNVQVQNKALERHAAGTLFPNQQETQSGADEPVDLFGQQSVTDGDEVPIENLIGELVNSMH